MTLDALYKNIVASGFWLACLAGSAVAQVQDGGRPAVTGVLELYTSQGCNSCPQADALLGVYAQRSDLVALTLPVDYWDYLGWKDTFASPKFTARQRAYAKERGDGRIYTPQIVVNGAMHLVGSNAADIDKVIAKSAAKFAAGRVPLTVRVEGDRLVIEVGDMVAGSGPRDATIWLAVIQKEAEVPIKTGENRGKSLKYFNIVRSLSPVGMWTGKAAKFEIVRDAVKLPGTQGCAVLLQSGAAGPIIAASMLPSF